MQRNMRQKGKTFSFFKGKEKEKVALLARDLGDAHHIFFFFIHSGASVWAFKKHCHFRMGSYLFSLQTVQPKKIKHKKRYFRINYPKDLKPLDNYTTPSTTERGENIEGSGRDRASHLSSLAEQERAVANWGRWTASDSVLGRYVNVDFKNSIYKSSKATFQTASCFSSQTLNL